jgi:prepilin-type N-terminal cleavage/methylation domain-containing protein
MKNGFTLMELLVVISIIGGLAALLLTNFVGIRGRAADVAKKNDVSQLKKALRLYYNDYQGYPLGSGGALMGCGATGTTSCAAGDEFSAGSSQTVYMKELPAGIAYYSDGGDGFVVIVALENASDEDVAASQNRCKPAQRAYVSEAVTSLDYVVCED